MYLQTRSVSKVGWIIAAIGAAVHLLSKGAVSDLAIIVWGLGAFLGFAAGIIYLVAGKQFDP